VNQVEKHGNHNVAHERCDTIKFVWSRVSVKVQGTHVKKRTRTNTCIFKKKKKKIKSHVTRIL
jgi:hypothetical protein